MVVWVGCCVPSGVIGCIGIVGVWVVRVPPLSGSGYPLSDVWVPLGEITSDTSVETISYLLFACRYRLHALDVGPRF